MQFFSLKFLRQNRTRLLCSVNISENMLKNWLYYYEHCWYFSFNFACSFTVLFGNIHKHQSFSARKKRTKETTFNDNSVYVITQSYQLIRLHLNHYYICMILLILKKYIVVASTTVQIQSIHCMHSTSTANIELFEAQEMQSVL